VAPAIKQLHGATSRKWNLADRMTGRRRVWYKFADRRIRDDRHLYKALNYIHGNPVKHGYRDSPGAWPWSSLRNYVTGEGMAWLRRIEAEYPPGDFGSGWDDL
ncbi:MAG: transposase, partial [Dehalococcoidia bacterium]